MCYIYLYVFVHLSIFKFLFLCSVCVEFKELLKEFKTCAQLCVFQRNPEYLPYRRIAMIWETT